MSVSILLYIILNIYYVMFPIFFLILVLIRSFFEECNNVAQNVVPFLTYLAWHSCLPFLTFMFSHYFGRLWVAKESALQWSYQIRENKRKKRNKKFKEIYVTSCLSSQMNFCQIISQFSIILIIFPNDSIKFLS